jgi:CheY-like chemotaxis protein
MLASLQAGKEGRVVNTHVRSRDSATAIPQRDRTQPSDAVLVVEDDDDTRDTLAMVLKQHGYDAVTVSNGAEALHRLRAGLRPGLILLDLHMPEKNGWQFRVEQILDPRFEMIPVVAYSGDPEAYADGLRLGAVACLRKPLEVERLIEIVRVHCGQPRRG